jgi:hypothetical protein
MALTAAPSAERMRITLRLTPRLHATTQEGVRLGLAPNQNAFIEDAIRLREREVRHAQMRRQAEEAMADPGFVADMYGTMAAFEHVDREHWPDFDDEDLLPAPDLGSSD